MNNRRLIINDPVYGFVTLPHGLLCDIIRHPLFQRLDRIRQLGLAGLVYPGAQHTRKQHSIGACHLMQQTFESLCGKGVFFFDAEMEATEAAILMHDLGHGPYSHVLEDMFIRGVHHEELSLHFMEIINADLHGALSLAIKIFKDEYPKHFLHELICSQLDMDRLDYLCRDSFFTGVREGSIGAERLIKMLNVVGEQLVVDHKGLYSVENYLMARRLMYWQVYLHKTAVAAEELLRSTLRRARWLIQSGVSLFCPPHLHFFLANDITPERFKACEECGEYYALLDDSDILSSIKIWQRSDDKILALLATSFINRRLFKVEVYDEAFPDGRMEELKEDIARKLHISNADAGYFVTFRTVEKEMYSATSEGINILYPTGEIKELSSISHLVRNESASLHDAKHYIMKLRTE